MKRLDYIDALRGFAIFLVILGHAIQQLNDGFYFLNNRVFTTIYSFHMPLFFFLSGLLFKNSLKQTYTKFISKKFTQLILPCLVWTLIFYCFNLFSIWIGKKEIAFNLDDILKLLSPGSWPFWFLVELFKSYILLFVLYKIIKNQFFVFLVSLILVFLIPSEGSQRFLLPFFMLGIMTRDNILLFEKRLKVLLGSFLFLFMICLLFWKGSFTIYFSAFPELYNFYTNQFSLKNYDVALFRFVIGLFGCYFWFLLFKYISDKKLMKIPMNWFSKIGKETLGIYILQKSILEIFLTDYIDFSFINKWITSIIILPVVSIFIIQVIMLMINIINRSKTARLLLIGKE